MLIYSNVITRKENDLTLTLSCPTDLFHGKERGYVSLLLEGREGWGQYSFIRSWT